MTTGEEEEAEKTQVFLCQATIEVYLDAKLTPVDAARCAFDAMIALYENNSDGNDGGLTIDVWQKSPEEAMHFVKLYSERPDVLEF